MEGGCSGVGGFCGGRGAVVIEVGGVGDNKEVGAYAVEHFCKVITLLIFFKAGKANALLLPPPSYS